jgi:hypothetical protein
MIKLNNENPPHLFHNVLILASAEELGRAEPRRVPLHYLELHNTGLKDAESSCTKMYKTFASTLMGEESLTVVEKLRNLLAPEG